MDPKESRAHEKSGAQRALLVVNCGQLVTVAGPARARTGAELHEPGILRDAAMYIENGRIAAVASYRELKAKVPPGVEEIDAGGRAVLPGFVDAHTHPVFGGNRIGDFEKRVAGSTYEEIAAAGGGIASTVRATREASEEELLQVAERHATWFLRGGTTTIEAKSGYGLSEESELKLLRVVCALGERSPLEIVPTLLAAHTVPAEFRQNRTAYVQLILNQIIPAVAEQSLARFCDVFCDQHAFTVEEARTILAAAKQHGLRLRAHVEQFAMDGGARMAAELGAATADHLECSDEAGFAALRQAGVQPVLLPASVFALGRGEYPRARAMIAAGLAPVLASDFNPGSSPVTSMPFILSLAALYLRMTPAEAVVAATINAAASLGLAHEIGSLEPGKRANFVIHECADYRELAYYIAAPARPRVFVAGCEVALR
ncbi:MAG: imidazolonepropionase [Acidobacteriota bacterium]